MSPIVFLRLTAVALLFAFAPSVASEASYGGAADGEPGPVLEHGRPRGLPLDALGQELDKAGVRVAIDNDLLAYGQGDFDYTAGVAVTLGGRRAASAWASIDPIAAWLDPLVPPLHAMPERTYTLHAMQVGFVAFTPDDLNTPVPILDDRPYASLVFLSNGRTFVSDPERPVYDTSFTFGVLGLEVAKGLQRGLHETLRLDEVPEGWDNQISDGGEPTFRFTWARQALLASDFQADRREHEIKWRVDASAGYLTEIGVSLTGRWGLINTPWWSFTPEHADYVLQPAPIIGTAVREDVRELYLWGGVKLRARGYNAFLQGQFRDSEVEYSSDEIERVIAEAWLGVTWQVTRAMRLSYVARFQTPELKEGRGSRDLRWAGLILTRTF